MYKAAVSRLIALAIILFPFQALATYECNVTVKNILVYSTGMVNVLHSGRGDYTMICSMNGDFGGVSNTTCAMWTALLQDIKKKNGIANFYFNGTGSCATLPTYANAPTPVYIGDVTP
jgi:hypothetical protein